LESEGTVLNSQALKPALRHNWDWWRQKPSLSITESLSGNGWICVLPDLTFSGSSYSIEDMPSLLILHLNLAGPKRKPCSKTDLDLE
jgi:hypothetical protein